MMQLKVLNLKGKKGQKKYRYIIKIELVKEILSKILNVSSQKIIINSSGTQSKNDKMLESNNKKFVLGIRKGALNYKQYESVYRFKNGGRLPLKQTVIQNISATIMNSVRIISHFHQIVKKQKEIVKPFLRDQKKGLRPSNIKLYIIKEQQKKKYLLLEEQKKALFKLIVQLRCIEINKCLIQNYVLIEDRQGQKALRTAKRQLQP